MARAQMHDGTYLDVAVVGDGPAILVPVRTRPIDPSTAEQIRAWGADPNLGQNLASGLAAAGLRVIAADYEGHLAEEPKPHTLTATNVAADLLAIADAAGADRFAYYGYSWLALAGLQLAIRTHRLTALAMGGYPPLDGPYAAMLTVTRATHRMAVANQGRQLDTGPIQPGDWDASEVTLSPDQAQQYLTLYESVQGFDERTALDQLTIPRLAFAGEKDNIAYGPKWDNSHVAIAEPLVRNRAELAGRGWTIEIVPDADHVSAMQAPKVLPILVPWLTSHLAPSAG